MIVKIICVGKLKERYLRDAIGEYTKRLGRYARVSIIEEKDEPAAEALSKRERAQILDTEGRRILDKINDRDYVVGLAIRGRELSSEDLASFIKDKMDHGSSTMCFVIGGSLGLSRDVENRADALISFSRLTFPHQLMRVILMEQIYRSFKIINHEPYHK